MIHEANLILDAPRGVGTRNARRNDKGFTIVELLIVIVVIAVLASISIVAFNGVQNRAESTKLQSDLRNAATQLGLKNAEVGAYPTGPLPIDISKSEGISFQYTSTGADYCLTATSSRGGVGAYFIRNNSVPQAGTCAGHSEGGALVALGGEESEFVGDGSNGESGVRYKVHKYLATGQSQFTVSSNTEVEYLIVGGGGGGTAGTSGGGGAGGLLVGTTTIEQGSHTIIVGAGGAPAAANQAGTSGLASSAFGMTAVGGGRGGGVLTDGGIVAIAQSGGSGGGGGRYSGVGVAQGADGTLGQGNKGGDAFSDSHSGGGGGGAGGPGLNASITGSGAGGQGLASYITGELKYYAAGGGGGSGSVRGIGGSGIGGAGRQQAGPLIIATSGVANTGSGGGGGWVYSGGSGGGGGSGVVILRYPMP